MPRPCYVRTSWGEPTKNSNNSSDLLTPLAPVITTRSDTFKIRAYGEATRGSETARAWCEAVVQRTPDYLDPTDTPETPVADLEPEGTNATFGRRLVLVSFRWLSPGEV